MGGWRADEKDSNGARDHLGGVLALATPGGDIVESYEYEPYGLPAIYDDEGEIVASRTSTVGNRFMFTGREWEPDGEFYHYRHRTYSPHEKRFMQRDPIGLSGGWNVYAYCGGDPANASDPMGLYSRVHVTGWDETNWRGVNDVYYDFGVEIYWIERVLDWYEASGRFKSQADQTALCLARASVNELKMLNRDRRISLWNKEYSRAAPDYRLVQRGINVSVFKFNTNLASKDRFTVGGLTYTMENYEVHQASLGTLLHEGLHHLQFRVLGANRCVEIADDDQDAGIGPEDPRARMEQLPSALQYWFDEIAYPTPPRSGEKLLKGWP